MTERNSCARGVSRRTFLEAGALAAAAGPSLAAWPKSSSALLEHSGPESPHTNYLEAAKEAARWIQSAEKQTDHGVYWLPEPDHQEKLVTVSPVNTLYSGSAGTVLFFLELAKVSGEESYWKTARSGADYLVHTWQDLKTPQKGFFQNSELGFSAGISGVAFVLAEVGKATGDARYTDAARTATKHIVEAARHVGSGTEWTGAPGVIGDGGIILYLLYAAQTFGDPTLLDAAVQGGNRLLELSEADPRGGIRWQGICPETIGYPKGTYWPNFEMGTAGVAYVLARLYAETKRKEFLDSAKEGAKHIQSIASVERDSALVYYREPDRKNLYYLGYCHGPAGTTRLFYQLYKLTNDPLYLQWTEHFARGVSGSGIPEKQTPGFWNVVCQCCGTAGVSELFLGLWAATKHPEYLAFAKRVADQTISRETDLDDKGYRWYQAWTRIKPWEVSAETGYMIGAAGVGSALLHVHLATKNQYEAILFPDNPYPRTARA